MNGFLTTHVLDTAKGCPAEGLEIELIRFEGLTPQLVVKATTNSDGRTDNPLLSKDECKHGRYEIVFHAGEYLKASGASADFLDIVPIRFGITEDDHYHVPLLLSPYSFSTYRGS